MTFDHTTSRPATACLALICMLAACVPRADITQTDGLHTIGTITHSDKDRVYVRHSDGRMEEVASQAILEIDHPGKVAMGLGIALFVAGIFVPSAYTDNSWVNFSVKLPGFALFSYGAYTRFHSQDAARNAGIPHLVRIEDTATPPPPAPTDQYLPAPTWSSFTKPTPAANRPDAGTPPPPDAAIPADASLDSGQ